jgi:hypothetical protein
MTKSLFAVLGVATLAAASAFAQGNTPLRVTVPFDFAAGKNALTAGEYYVRISYSPNAVWLQKADGGGGVVVLSHGVRPEGIAAETGSLMFHVYGNRYFLSQVFTSGMNQGAELPKSHDEVVQIAARHASKTITVIASLR